MESSHWLNPLNSLTHSCFGGLAERRVEFDLVSDLDQHVDATQIEIVDDGTHVEVTQTKISNDAQVADRLPFFLVLLQRLLPR